MDEKKPKWLWFTLGCLVLLLAPLFTVLGMWFGPPTSEIENSPPPAFIVEQSGTIDTVPDEASLDSLVDAASVENTNAPERLPNSETIQAVADSALSGESPPDAYVALLLHEDLQTRIEAARSFTHGSHGSFGDKINDDGLDYVDVQQAFWEKIGAEDTASIRNTLFEALVEAVEHDRDTAAIPNVLYYMSLPDEKPHPEIIEVLGWVAASHPQGPERKRAMYSMFGLEPDGDHLGQILRERRRDPSLNVRMHATAIQFERILLMR